MKIRNYLSNYQIFAIGFALIILIGGIVLSLPVSSTTGDNTPFVDALFTSTSAVCVTGLIAYDTFTHWSLFGKIVIITLIQIGGLGFMTIVTIGTILMGKKIGAYERLLVTQSSGAMSSGQVISLVKKIVFGSLLVELIGALLLSFRFCPQFGFIKGIGISLFHAISAFCNAGFDLFGRFGEFSSLVPYVGDYFVNYVIMVLITVGGIGFVVWDDVMRHKLKLSKYSFHSKVVIATSMALVLSGFVIFLVLEYNNTLSGLGFFEKITAALFLSVSPRTAGFNTVSVGDLTESSKLISSVLMLVGGSPGSTAGGMKTTTLAVMLISAVAAVRGADETVVFKRKLEKDVIHQAVAIFTVYISVVIFSTVIISTYEGLPLIDVLFETASAAGTVGMTTGITQRLKIFSKIILMVLMFSGRIGILTFAMAVGKKRKKSHISRPTDKLMIG